NKSIRRLRRAFASGTELSNLLLADEFASTQAHQPQSTWVAFPMKNRKKVIGALLLEFSPAHSEEDLALLGSIANELAVAMDNAISYQLITELRDTLELRVNERTQELELARTRLEQTVQRLEESDQAKRDFFTNVSHELKTPLTLISAPLDNIEDALPEDNHNAKEHVLLIRENTQTLLALLNEILDFAKLDTNDLELVNVEFDISRMLDDLCTALKPLADRKHLSFQVYLPQEPIFAYGDRKMLRRVTTNLLVNAIKYVEEGDTVKVRLSRVDTDIVLEVADTGPGIPEKEQDKIFERFHRAQDTHGRTIEGSGIGLAMAREIIELHGGHISIQSAVNEGATFTVQLPQEEALLTPTSIPILQSHEDNEDWLDDIQPTPIFGSSTSHDALSTQQTKVNGSRILLVEDNPKMRRFLTTVLSAHYQIYTAHDGREGLELAKKQRPELILSDVMMPHMNGYELCRAIKHDPHMRLTPIILISAKYGTEAALEAFEANADDFVIKPFSPSELIARINAQLKIRSLTLSLLRMEKQSTLGFMAAGLAHEIYNPINAIINATPPLRSLVVKPQPEGASPTIEAELLEAIELSGQKIRKVIDAVLAMARQDDTELYLEKTSISKEFESILAILGYRIHSGYQIHQEYEWNEPFYCYPKLLSQVLMNLLSNALDALDPEGGDIWLKVQRKDDRVVLQMENNGPPIPPGDREKIFMPFYTTKDPDKGTGLGLAICREVTEIHKGTLQLVPDSEHTTFSLELPYISQPT
ncbi:MAG TPA: hypothetical protein DCE42_13375, partial [Myxococcales bacterium]|nr:hypothetical protein [Myxococcales bacterium]